jgi:hypothetical protein
MPTLIITALPPPPPPLSPPPLLLLPCRRPLPLPRQVCQVLLEAGADIGARDHFQRTPLHYAQNAKVRTPVQSTVLAAPGCCCLQWRSRHTNCTAAQA